MMRLLKLVGLFVLVLSFCGCVHDVYKAVDEPCDNVYLTLITTDYVGNVSSLPEDVKSVDIFFYEGGSLADLPTADSNPIHLLREDWVAVNNVVPLSIQSGSYRIVAWANVTGTEDADGKSWFSKKESLSAARVSNKINVAGDDTKSIKNQDRLYYAEPSSFTYAGSNSRGPINIVVPSFGEKYQTLSFSPVTIGVEVLLDKHELASPDDYPLVTIFESSSEERKGFTSQLTFDNVPTTASGDPADLVEYSQKASTPVTYDGRRMYAASFNLPLFDDDTPLFIDIADGLGTLIDLQKLRLEGKNTWSIANGTRSIPTIIVRYTKGKEASVTIADWLSGADGGIMPVL